MPELGDAGLASSPASDFKCHARGGSVTVAEGIDELVPVKLPVRRQLLQPFHEGWLAMTHGTVRQRGAIDIPDETHIVVEVVEASFNLTASVGRIDPGDDLDWSFHRTGFPDDNRSRQSKSQNDLMSTCPVQTRTVLLCRNGPRRSPFVDGDHDEIGVGHLDLVVGQVALGPGLDLDGH